MCWTQALTQLQQQAFCFETGSLISPEAGLNFVILRPPPPCVTMSGLGLCYNEVMKMLFKNVTWGWEGICYLTWRELIPTNSSVTSTCALWHAQPPPPSRKKKKRS